MEDAREYDDIGLEEMRESYPQYDNMDYHDLLSNFDELTGRLHREVKYGSDPLAITDINRELNYVKKVMEERGTANTSFTEGEEGTVNIAGPSGSTTVPDVEFVEDPAGLLSDVLDAFNDSFDDNHYDIEDRLSKLKNISKDRLTAAKKRDFENQVKRVQAVVRVAQAKEKIVLNPKRSSVKSLNDGTEVLMFRSEKGIDKSGTQIMKRGKTSIPTYSKNSLALREYKELVRKIKEKAVDSSQAYANEAFEGDDDESVVTESTAVDRGAASNDFDDEDNTFENIELIDVRVTSDDIPGLTPEENAELRGVLNPTDTMDWESRLGENGALQKQIEFFQDSINVLMELRDETDDTEEFIVLEERIVALREARDRTVMQKELEEGRQAQEEDISRFHNFAKWAKADMVDLAGLTLSTAGLITALLIHARGAIVGASKATGKVAKALANVAKTGAPVLVPVLNAIATVLSWGAKGIAWLTSHIWVLVVAVSLLVYDCLQR